MVDENLYPEAGYREQPEVRAAIARFRALPPNERAARPLIWWLLNESTQAVKMSQQDALYTEQSRGPQTCGTCRYLYLSNFWRRHICSMIQGNDISPAGWCRLWEGGA